MGIRIVLFLSFLGTAVGQGGQFIDIPCEPGNDTICGSGAFCGGFSDPFSSEFINRCQCLEGYSNVNGADTCMKLIDSIGAACDDTQNMICNAALHLICVDSLCACAEGFANVSGTCTKSVDNGEACDVALNIICKDVNSACTANTCQCVDGFRYEVDTCVWDAQLSQSCDGDVYLCTVANAECTNNTCLCSGEHFEHESACVRTVGYGEDCTPDDVICGDSFTECTNGVCACVTDYNYESARQACATDVPLLAQCDTHARCGTEFAHCDNGTCACQEEYTKIRTSCVSTTAELINTLGISCASPLRCTVPGSICAELADGLGGTESMCVCDITQGWEVVEENGQKKCTLAVAVWEVCDLTRSYCADDNAQCLLSADNSGVRRCLCDDGFVEVNSTCAKIVPIQLDSSCAQCVDNGGICYDNVLDDDATQNEGCKCPASAIGPLCESFMLDVHCPANPFRMYICYTQQAGYDFQAGAKLYTEGHANNAECRGFPILTENSYCGQDQIQLMLSLDDARLPTCATTDLSANGQRRYSNIITVSPSDQRLATKSFEVYCQFVNVHTVGTPDVQAVGIPGNNRGQTVVPELSFFVQNNLRQNVPEGTAMRIGDAIYTVIELAESDTYSTFNVENCVASNSPNPSDSHAVAMQLILDGCPYSNQNHINNLNDFVRSTDGRELSAGPITVFNLGDGNSVFFHCMVKLCLVGDEANCAAESCGNGHEGFGRRKRDVSDDDTVAELTRELIWYQEEETELQIAYSTFLAVTVPLAILLLIFVIFCILLLWQLCMRGGKAEDTPPQRFALPRMNNNPHLRL